MIFTVKSERPNVILRGKRRPTPDSCPLAGTCVLSYTHTHTHTHTHMHTHTHTHTHVHTHTLVGVCVVSVCVCLCECVCVCVEYVHGRYMDTWLYVCDV
jgi:hypothetical protein